MLTVHSLSDTGEGAVTWKVAQKATVDDSGAESESSSEEEESEASDAEENTSINEDTVAKPSVVVEEFGPTQRVRRGTNVLALSKDDIRHALLGTERSCQHQSGSCCTCNSSSSSSCAALHLATLLCHQLPRRSAHETAFKDEQYGHSAGVSNPSMPQQSSTLPSSKHPRTVVAQVLCSVWNQS